jgi:hypothetical protein
MGGCNSGFIDGLLQHDAKVLTALTLTAVCNNKKLIKTFLNWSCFHTTAKRKL